VTHIQYLGLRHLHHNPVGSGLQRCRLEAVVDFDEDRVIQFHLPTGAGETLTTLIAGLRAEGDGWQWRVDSITPLGGVIGAYTFDGGKRERHSFLSTSWHNRGDGSALVALRCESEALWRAGVYHKLLDNIVAVWPETKTELDRALGMDGEVGEKAGERKDFPGELKKRRKGVHSAYSPDEQRKLVDEYRRLNENGKRITQEVFAGMKMISVRTFRTYLKNYPPKEETES